MIDLTDLKHHVAAPDAAGRPVLVQKPLPPEFATASPGSRLVYRRSIQAEEQEVIIAARRAIMPPRPPGYDQMSAMSRRAWWLLAEKSQKETRR